MAAIIVADTAGQGQNLGKFVIALTYTGKLEIDQHLH